MTSKTHSPWPDRAYSLKGERPANQNCSPVIITRAGAEKKKWPACDLGVQVASFLRVLRDTSPRRGRQTESLQQEQELACVVGSFWS